MHIMCTYISVWFLFCFDFSSKGTVLRFILCKLFVSIFNFVHFCDASAGEEMQTRRPSAGIAVMAFCISSRDTIFFCFMRRNLFQ